MRDLYTLAVAALACLGASAQVVTTSPSIVQTSSEGITVYYHADQGNKGLMDLPASTKIYAHTGLITTASKNDADWKYATKWLQNDAKYELTYVSPNLYRLDIGSLGEYYGCPDPTTIKKIAFVFRTATGNKEGKAANGGDIFVDVYEPGFQITFDTDAPSLIFGKGTYVFTVNSTSAADISIAVGDDAPFAQGTGKTQLSGAYTFTQAGKFTVTATARFGSETRTKTIDLEVFANSQESPYPGGTPVMGAVPAEGGGITFCLAAPDKENVILRGSWDDYAFSQASVMNKCTYGGVTYFWTTVSSLDPAEDYIYFYNVDGEKNVADPYAHLVLDPWNDRYISRSVFPGIPTFPTAAAGSTPVAWYSPSLAEYQWQCDDFVRPDQNSLVVYELLIRDFTGTEGASAGNGTVKGVIEKLDYLKELGVNAIELLPIMEFNGNLSWGYNTNFYMATDKAYGTPAMYKQLIDEAHARGMAVILDIVFNQSDGLHPWYMMYPVEKNPFYNSNAPHAYSVLNDWNQDYPLVQTQWHDALRYWLTEFRVDGFRFDLVKGLGDNDSYNATYNPATNGWTGVTDAKTNAYNASRVARMKELHDAMRLVDPTAYFINENLAGAKEEIEMAADGELNWANINDASCQFAMGYPSNSSLNRFYAPMDGSRQWGSTVSYAESHDEERMAYKQTKWGVAGVKGNLAVSMRRLGSVAAQMLMTPGLHMIWQFQEFGADQTTKDSGGGNDTSNKKVIWKYLEVPERAALRDEYAALLKVRNENPSLFDNQVSTSVSLSATSSCRSIVLRNTATSDALYLVVNPSVDQTLTATTDQNLGGDAFQLMCCSYNTTPQASEAGVVLAPGAWALYGSRGLQGGIDDTAIGRDTPVTIYGIEGGIVVEGTDSPVQAYTVGAVQVPLTGLTPGLYIVRAGSTAAKVRVY